MDLEDVGRGARRHDNPTRIDDDVLFDLGGRRDVSSLVARVLRPGAAVILVPVEGSRIRIAARIIRLPARSLLAVHRIGPFRCRYHRSTRRRKRGRAQTRQGGCSPGAFGKCLDADVPPGSPFPLWVGEGPSLLSDGGIAAQLTEEQESGILNASPEDTPEREHQLRKGGKVTPGGVAKFVRTEAAGLGAPVSRPDNWRSMTGASKNPRDQPESRRLQATVLTVPLLSPQMVTHQGPDRRITCRGPCRGSAPPFPQGRAD
jgi:hypothetical protein